MNNGAVELGKQDVGDCQPGLPPAGLITPAPTQRVPLTLCI